MTVFAMAVLLNKRYAIRWYL